MKKNAVVFLLLQFVDKVLSYPLASSRIVNDKCSDPHYECSNGTCCKTFDGQFGCCPFEDAECCADGKHCCPPGQKCDVEAGRCIRQNLASAPVHSNQFFYFFLANS